MRIRLRTAQPQPALTPPGHRRTVARLATVVVATLGLVLGMAGTAFAVTDADRLRVATSWSQSTAASQSGWNAGRLNQGAWAAYNFDWSTDLCSSSPDQPFGYDFRMPCTRHDFGYRNFKRLSAFPANKPRIDDAFYWDMRQVCAARGNPQLCLSTAWTYYQAVKQFGAVSVSKSELDRLSKTAA